MKTLQNNDYTFIAIRNDDIELLNIVLLRSLLSLKNAYVNSDSNEQRSILAQEYLIVNFLHKIHHIDFFDHEWDGWKEFESFFKEN